MVNRLVILIFLLCGTLPAVALAQDDDAEHLRIHGSNVLGSSLVPAMVDSWLRDIGYGGIVRRDPSPTRTEIHAIRDGEKLVVEIEKRGTASGLSALVDGNAEISMSARQPDAKEIDAAWQLGDLKSPGQEWVIGLDGLAVLVGPGNSTEQVGVEQLRGLLTGKITDWRALGGRPGPIHAYAMAAGTGTGELTDELVLRGARMAGGTRTYRSYALLVAALRADPAGIGIVALRAPHASLKALAIRSGGVAAKPERLAVSAEDYPLQHRIYLHTGQLITALGRGFAQYAVSPAGQVVVERSQFLSLNLRPMAPDKLEQAPREYLQLIASARRLPMTIRFGTGLDIFDSRSRQDVERLTAFLQRPENASRRVMLIGFANPQPQSPYQSLSLSQERVDYVSSELLALDVKVVSVRGFGGSRNLVDAGQRSARYRNDRVEVWLR